MLPMKPHQILAFSAFGLFLVASTTLSGGELLKMRVSPAVSLAPALLTVQLSVETDPDNRMLEVSATSADFYRSSEIQLDGVSAPHVSVVEFRNLPTGVYEVSGVLVGAHGPRASVSRTARVAPAAGAR